MAFTNNKTQKKEATYAYARVAGFNWMRPNQFGTPKIARVLHMLLNLQQPSWQGKTTPPSLRRTRRRAAVLLLCDRLAMMRACLFFAAVLAVGDRCLGFTTVPSAASIRVLGATQVPNRCHCSYVYISRTSTALESIILFLQPTAGRI